MQSRDAIRDSRLVADTRSGAARVSVNLERQSRRLFNLAICRERVTAAKCALDGRLRAVEAGANDFIAKPVDLAELRVRTSSLLKMKAAQDAVAAQILAGFH